MHTFELGTLYTHWKHGQVFMLLSDDRFTVTVQNLTLDMRFMIPVDQFISCWLPFLEEGT